jgi:uncharacterized protein DUF5681
MTEPANAAGKQRGNPFQKGQSGNPAGKPKGARHRTTVAIEALLEGQATAIGQKCVEMALAGDTTALRLAMERIAPTRRGRPVRFSLPALDTAGDLPKALSAVLAAVAEGSLTPDEAVSLAQIVEVRRRAIELVEIEARLAVLEQSQAGAR